MVESRPAHQSSTDASKLQSKAGNHSEGSRGVSADTMIPTARLIGIGAQMSLDVRFLSSAVLCDGFGESGLRAALACHRPHGLRMPESCEIILCSILLCLWGNLSVTWREVPGVVHRHGGHLWKCCTLGPSLACPPILALTRVPHKACCWGWGEVMSVERHHLRLWMAHQHCPLV